MSYLKRPLRTLNSQKIATGWQKRHDVSVPAEYWRPMWRQTVAQWWMPLSSCFCLFPVHQVFKRHALWNKRSCVFCSPLLSRCSVYPGWYSSICHSTITTKTQQFISYEYIYTNNTWCLMSSPIIILTRRCKRHCWNQWSFYVALHFFWRIQWFVQLSFGCK